MQIDMLLITPITVSQWSTNILVFGGCPRSFAQTGT